MARNSTVELCTIRFAMTDDPAETRIMHRVTVCGDVPF
jgi:taurine dioxygenase